MELGACKKGRVRKCVTISLCVHRKEIEESLGKDKDQIF